MTTPRASRNAAQGSRADSAATLEQLFVLVLVLETCLVSFGECARTRLVARIAVCAVS